MSDRFNYDDPGLSLTKEDQKYFLLTEEESALIDAYIKREWPNIKLHAEAVMARQKISPRDVLAMNEAEFEQFCDVLFDNGVPVSEAKQLVTFKKGFLDGFTHEAVANLCEQHEKELHKNGQTAPRKPLRCMAAEHIAATGNESKEVLGLTEEEYRLLDEYITDNLYLIGPRIDLFLVEQRLTPRKVLAMPQEKFEALNDLKLQKPISYVEGANLIAFKSYFIGGLSGGMLKTLHDAKMGHGPETQHDEAPSGDKKLQRHVITMLGGLPVVGVDRYNTNIIVNDREINIPRDMVKSPQGKWGSAFVLSEAAYVETKEKVGADVIERIRAAIKAAYDEEDAYVKFE